MSTNISTTHTNGNQWKPRKTETITCPSGQVVQVRRPGPEFTLRAGKVARTFTATAQEIVKEERKNKTPEEIFAEMSDDELAAVLVFARELVIAMLVSPKLVLNPNPDRDEIGPEDVPGADFWFLFNYGITSFMGIKVPVGESEVEVSDLKSFREESGVSGDGVDGPRIPSDAEQSLGDQGLVGSA